MTGANPQQIRERKKLFSTKEMLPKPINSNHYFSMQATILKMPRNQNLSTLYHVPRVLDYMRVKHVGISASKNII